jgi:hypothetical protein
VRGPLVLALYHLTVAALFVLGAAYLVAGVCYGLGQATVAAFGL